MTTTVSDAPNGMECETCHRSDPDKLFYCSGCLAARLADHHHQRLRLLDALKAQARRAEHLLGPQPPSGPGAPGPGQGTPLGQGHGHGHGQSALGVTEERLKKAEKWTLAVRVRDLRFLKDELGAKEGEVRTSLLTRRAALEKRKRNLSEAKVILTTLTSGNDIDSLNLAVATDSLAAAAPRPPAALSSLSATQTSTQAIHASLTRQMYQTRAILTRELLSIYGFGPVAPSPSASTLSPFVDPRHDSDTAQHGNPTPPPLPTYSIAGLPLPPLSQLLSLPPVVLSASLSHLLHLTRLLAFYTQQEALPFTPFPSLYGQGLPGLRAAPGWPATSDSAEFPSASAASPARPSSSTKPRAYPLFVSRKHAPVSLGLAAEGSDFGSGSGTQEAEEEGSGSVLARSGEGDSSGRAREKRAQAVRKGVVALAYDLAWLAWGQGHLFEGTLAELEDVGGLVARAAAPARSGSQAESSPAPTPPRAGVIGVASPVLPAAQVSEEGKADFPFDFDALAREFMASLEGVSGGGAESVVLVAKPGAGAGSAEGDDDEWDLVEAAV